MTQDQKIISNLLSYYSRYSTIGTDSNIKHSADAVVLYKWIGNFKQKEDLIIPTLILKSSNYTNAITTRNRNLLDKEPHPIIVYDIVSYHGNNRSTYYGTIASVKTAFIKFFRQCYFTRVTVKDYVMYMGYGIILDSDGVLLFLDSRVVEPKTFSEKGIKWYFHPRVFKSEKNALYKLISGLLFNTAVSAKLGEVTIDDRDISIDIEVTDKIPYLHQIVCKETSIDPVEEAYEILNEHLLNLVNSFDREVTHEYE